MTRTDRALSWAYLIGAVLALHCATNSTPWYAAGLAATSALLVVALVREYLVADERRAAAVRAERAARLRALDDERAMATAVKGLANACCEMWWTSCGASHTSTCKGERRTV